jgi:hypothetical protein
MVTPHDCEDECSLSMQRLYLVHEPYEYAALSGETEAHVLALGQSDGYTQKVRLLREGKGQYEIMVAGRLSGLIGSAQNTEYVTALSSYNKAYVINTSSGVSRIIDLQPSLGAYSKPALLSACGTLLIYAAQQDEKGNRGLHIIEQEIEVPQRSCASMLLNAPGNYVQSILSNGTLVIV